MMKNLLLTVALSAVAVAGNAQALVANKTLNKVVQNKVMTVAPQSRNFQVSKTAAPKKSPSSGVGYARPEGTMYSSYYFGSDGDMSALMVPSIMDITFEHYCSGTPTWSINGTELPDSYLDASGNLSYSYPIVPQDDEYGYAAYYAPTLTYSKEDFNLTDLIMLTNDYQPVTPVNPVLVNHYTGFTDGPAWGSGSVLEEAIEEQVSGAEPFGTFQAFDKPVTPMSLYDIFATCWSESSTPLNGKELTAKLYRLPTEEGETLDLDNPVATFVCKDDPEMNPFSSGDGYYGQMNFYNYVEDPVLGETEEPVVVDYAFGILLEGYDQDGVDVRFLLCDQGEDANEVPYAYPTRIATRVNGEVSYYYWAGTYQGEDYMYALPFNLDVLYDVAQVWEVGYTQAGDVVTGMNRFTISNDGKSFWRESDETMAACVGYISTEYPWFDDAAEAQYKFEGCPDWLTIGVESADFDEESDMAYTTYVAVEATALPSDVEGRVATVYVTSDKGAKSSVPFVFTQGNGAAAVESVSATVNKQDGAIYNVAGQKVNADFKGLTIQNGKKVIK